MHFQGMILFQLVSIGVGNMVSLRVPFGVGIAENGQREVRAFVESANANFRYGSGEKDGTQGAAPVSYTHLDVYKRQAWA